MRKILKWIKKVGKFLWILIRKTWEFIIGIAFWFLTCIIIYKQAEIQITDKIQAWAIVTLIFVTIFYAIQTQRLVQQGKISLKDQIKKRNADYGEKLLQNFFLPLIFKFIDLEAIIKKIPGLSELNNKIRPAVEIVNEITGLYKKYGYIATKEMMGSLANISNALQKIVDIRHGEENHFKIWKDEMNSLIKRANKIVLKQSKIHVKKINVI